MNVDTLETLSHFFSNLIAFLITINVIFKEMVSYDLLDFWLEGFHYRKARLNVVKFTNKNLLTKRILMHHVANLKWATGMYEDSTGPR